MNLWDWQMIDNDTDNTPILFIVRGLPGSGKTTFVKENKIECLHLEADMLCYKAASYQWRGENVKENHETCFEIAKLVFSRGADLCISNTFTQKWEFAHYVHLAKSLGYCVEVYRMDDDFGNTHSVPEEIVQKMKNRFEDYEGETIVKLQK
jgi:predicted kinase